MQRKGPGVFQADIFESVIGRSHFFLEVNDYG